MHHQLAVPHRFIETAVLQEIGFEEPQPSGGRSGQCGEMGNVRSVCRIADSAIDIDAALQQLFYYSGGDITAYSCDQHRFGFIDFAHKTLLNRGR